MGRSVWDLWWTGWYWARFSLSILIFPCQYYSVNGPHLTLTLYDLSNCQCCEMKSPSKMYRMRLKNLRISNFIKSLITSKIYYAAAWNLSYVCNWLLGRGWNILWQSAAVEQLSLLRIWCRVVLYIHFTYLNNELFHLLRRCQHYWYPYTVNVTPEHNSYKISLLDRFRGGTSPCVLWSETYCIHFEEFDAQFDDLGAFVY